MSENRGCLGGFSRFSQDNKHEGIVVTHLGPEKEILPYQLRDDFMSNAEISFYHVLRLALDGKGIICPKVSLAELFFVTDKAQFQRYFNMISRKRVDFVVCDPATLKPLCAIELDDKSHQKADRQDRDEFVEDLFMQTGTKLLRVPVKAQYSVAEVKQWIQNTIAALNIPTSADPVPATPNTPPLCPKCGIPMIKRTAQSGPNTGKEFYGCVNYPHCKQIISIS